MIGTICGTQKEIITDFCKRMLLNPFVREDYSELLELTLVCLGDTSEQVVFRRPGALHHARWMAKAIYGLKMYLFRHQVTVDHINLERFVKFVVEIYIRGWYDAPSPTNAPQNDFKFMKSLKLYHDKDIRRNTVEKFERHLWYLSEINISLAFFDDNVDVDVKMRMVANLKKKSSGNIKKVTKFSDKKKLEDYVTSQSLEFFHILRLDSKFLHEEDPKFWKNRSDYLVAQERCNSLSVINDAAERALGAAGDYNDFGPKSDQEKFQLLITVAENRKRQNNSLKSSVINYLAS